MSRTSHPCSTRQLPTAVRRTGCRRRGLWVAALLLALCTALWGVGVARSVVRLQGRVAELERVASGPVDGLLSIGSTLSAARTDFAVLERWLGPLPAIAQGLGWLPLVGYDLAAVAPMLEAVGATLDSADALAGALLPFASRGAELTLNDLGDPALAAEFEAALPRLVAASAAADRAMDSWASVSLGDLTPGVRTQARRAYAVSALLHAAADLAVASVEFRHAATPVLPFLQGALPDLAAFQMLAANEQQLAAVVRAAVEAEGSWAAVPLDALSDKTGERLRPLGASVVVLRAAAETLEAVGVASGSVMPVLNALNGGAELGPTLATGLDVGQARIEAALSQFAEAQSAWAVVPGQNLPKTLEPLVERMPVAVAEVHDALALAGHLPDLLGARGPRRYLLIAQNPDELRPTGGYFSSAGVVTLAGGRLGPLVMEDAYDIDVPLRGPRPAPPAPFARYMDIHLWLFRDANWSPDFPTAAVNARRLYALSGREPAEDVVAFTPEALRRVLRVTGPLEVKGSANLVDADTLQVYMEQQYDALRRSSDSFSGPLVQGVTERLAGALDLTTAVSLLKECRKLLREGHILLALHRSEEAALIARLGWDGAVRPGAGDYIRVVDANVGYNKANRMIQQELAYDVDLSYPSIPVATLTIAHDHLLESSIDCKTQQDQAQTYAEWTRLCYRDYMRVFVPGEARLLQAIADPTPGSATWSGEPDPGGVHVASGPGGTREFAAYLVVPTGGQRLTVMRYSLPTTVLARSENILTYSLLVQKQPGRESLPLDVRLTLPPGATLLSASPGARIQDDGSVVWRLRLATDQALQVTISLPIDSAWSLP